MNNIIDNPFINIRSLLINNNDPDNQIVLNQDNIYKYYNNVFIIVNKNNKYVDSDIYKHKIDKDIFDKISKNLILYITNIRILLNNSHFNNLIIMKKNFLEQYNIFEYELGEYNLVLPIFNINYQDLLQYLIQYNPTNTLINLLKIDTINSYFNKSTNYSKFIKNLCEADYWTNIHNCKLNIDYKFKNKKITFNISRLKQEIGISILNILNNLKIDNPKKDDNNEDYIKNIDLNQQNKECNENNSDVDDNSSNYKYKINNLTNDLINYDNVNQLFNNLCIKNKLLLVCNLLVSKKYCHFVINNHNILYLMKDKIYEHAPLFRYVMGYSWLKLYMDEIKLNTFVKTSDNIIFNINTASLLPVFPFCGKNPKLNPYMVILINDKLLISGSNILGIEDYNDLIKIENRGICNFEEFKIRLNIFCTGNDNIDIFDNIDFKKYNIAISGSVITGCIQRYHPLLTRFKVESFNEKLNAFFEEYYNEADIDIMFKTKDNLVYLDNVYAFYQDIKESLKNKFNNFVDNDINISLNKINYLFVSEEFINNNIIFDDIEKDNNKIKYITDNINSFEIVNIFKPYFNKLMNKKINDLNLKGIDNDKYIDLFLDNEEFKIYINKLNKIHIYVDSSYKYKIFSKYILHKFELFNIKEDDFFGTVVKFHLPCVRGYYDKYDVYLLPSCIIAHMTFINIDYRYMHGSQDPIHILNKYRSRGFGTYLNQSDIKLYSDYIETINPWNKLYKLQSLNGSLSLNVKLFRPRLYNSEYYNDDINTTNRYIDTQLPNSISNLLSLYKSISSVTSDRFKSLLLKPELKNKLDNLTTINKTGNVNIINKLFIYEYINSFFY
jgi:hypothetical protein